MKKSTKSLIPSERKQLKVLKQLILNKLVENELLMEVENETFYVEAAILSLKQRDTMVALKYLVCLLLNKDKHNGPVQAKPTR